MLNYIKSQSLLFFVALFALTACGDDELQDADPTLIPSVAQLTFGNEAETKTFSVISSAGWTVFADKDWVTVTQNSSAAGTSEVAVKVTANTATEPRTAIVTLKSGVVRAYVNVTQAATKKAEEDDTDIKCPIDGYSLAWSDEFDGTALNTTDWVYETGAHGWGNNEIQNYVANSKVATVSNGTLKINLFKENGTVYSARIKARPRTGWKYGYVEARLKLPKGKGTWPAFWMMPSAGGTWPDNGEIDIMEEVGYQPNKIFSTIHCKRYNNTGTSIEGNNKTIATAQTEFHTYGMEWTSQKIDFYIDGVKFFTYKNDGKGHDSWPFDAAFYPILNLAWGGNWGGAQGIDESALPAVYEIDYVRIFQK